MKLLKYLSLPLTSLFLITGCSFKPDIIVVKDEEKPQKVEKKYEKIPYLKGNLKKVDFKDLEGFNKDDLGLAFKVFKHSCKKSFKKELFKDVCYVTNSYDNPYKFFTENFTPFKLYDSKDYDKGVITGYYEPLLYGSLKQSKKYKYPIYKTPKDLINVDLASLYPQLKGLTLRGKIEGNKLVPYNDRSILDTKINKKDVLVWVDNKIDLFFLHIQGSGKVKVTNGDIINIGFSNKNGHPYKSIGKYMIENNMIGKNTGYEASTQGMKKWFKDNPKKVQEVLNQNPSYVFFQKNKLGATGSLGVELTPKRHLAVDRKYIKLGTPVFIKTKNPISKKNINQLMVAGDTGGAIKGDIRADFFWGFGKNAEEYAGRMKEQGELFILLPNSSL